MSKPTNELKKNVQSSNVDDAIKTAPDGRLIILDEPSETVQKLGQFKIMLIHLYTKIICEFE